MKTDNFIDISSLIPYMAKVWVSSYGSKFCQPIKLHGSLKFDISRKKWMMNLIFGMQINIKVFYKFILSLWLRTTRYAECTQNKFAYLFSISRKACDMKLSFFQQINEKIIDKLIVTPWLCIARHAQNTWSKKFTISLQYIKENVKAEVDFYLLIKSRFLQSDTFILHVCGQACPNYPK